MIVPPAWSKWKLAHAYNRIGSGTTPTSGSADYYDEDVGTPWITTAELRENYIHKTSLRVTDAALGDFSTLRVYAKNSVLMAMYGATIGRLGMTAIEATCNQACCVFEHSDIFENRFLYYWLWHRRPELINLSVGGGQPNLSQQDLKSEIAICPPLETQKRIIAFLDKKTAQIDGLIAKKQALLERLAEKRQAIITQAVTKGLNSAAAMKDSGIDWLGNVPAHWEVRGLTKCTTRIDYRGATPEKSPSGVFLVTARNIKNGKIDYALSEEFILEQDYEHVMRRGMPEVGDVLFTTEAPLGEIATIDRTDIALAQRVIKFRHSTDELDNYYLAFWMQSSAFQYDVKSRATGSTALGLKASKIVELRCLLPPIEEQKTIVSHTNEHLGNIDNVRKRIDQSLEYLNDYRSSLITFAVTGQIKGLQ